MMDDKVEIGWKRTSSGYACPNIGLTIERQVGTGKPVWVLQCPECAAVTLPTLKAAKAHALKVWTMVVEKLKQDDGLWNRLCDMVGEVK